MERIIEKMIIVTVTGAVGFVAGYLVSKAEDINFAIKIFKACNDEYENRRVRVKYSDYFRK